MRWLTFVLLVFRPKSIQRERNFTQWLSSELFLVLCWTHLTKEDKQCSYEITLNKPSIFDRAEVEYSYWINSQRLITVKEKLMSEDLNQSEPQSPQLGPYETEVQQGRPYLWCACGHSQAQPFCNGAHRATSFLPLVHQAEKTGKVYFCGCKRTKSPPFCDGTHNTLWLMMLILNPSSGRSPS